MNHLLDELDAVIEGKNRVAESIRVLFGQVEIQKRLLDFSREILNNLIAAVETAFVEGHAVSYFEPPVSTMAIQEMRSLIQEAVQVTEWKITDAEQIRSILSRLSEQRNSFADPFFELSSRLREARLRFVCGWGGATPAESSDVQAPADLRESLEKIITGEMTDPHEIRETIGRARLAMNSLTATVARAEREYFNPMIYGPENSGQTPVSQ